MPKLVLLQALRAAAALAIAVHHAIHEAGLLAGRTGPARSTFAWEAGVDVFLVVSGFVIVWASGPLFAAPGGPREFIARRIARVVPLYWLATTLVLALALAMSGAVRGPPPEPGFALASYLFWPAARPDGTVQPLYSLGWTLNYEMLFYSLFAVAIALPRRRAVAAVAAALVGAVALGRSVPSLPTPLAFWSNPIVLEFVAGMGLGLLRSEGWTLSGPVRAAMAAASLAALALAPPADALAWTRALAYGAPAALLVASCGLGRAEPGRATPLTRIGVALGDASYAIYLVHPFVLRGLRQVFATTDVATPDLAFVALGLAATIAVSCAVHALVERPLTYLARRALEAPRGR